MNLNKIFVLGRLGKDPELKSTPSGARVCTFSIATSKVWKDKNGEQQEDTEWHNIVFWNKPAEVIEKYVKKGSLLLVEGHVKTRSWEDKDSGKKMYRTEVIGENFQLPPKNTSQDGDGSTQSKPKNKEEVGEIDFPEDDIDPNDIPF